MSEIGRGGDYGAEEDRLPWLEPVDEEPIEEGVSATRLIAGLVVALIALGLVVGGVYWLKQRAGGPGTVDGQPTMIAAAPGPIKTKPDQPGGMEVKGKGDSSYAASEGADPKAQIDLSAVPEAPVKKGEAAPAPKPTPTPAPVVKTAAPAPVAKPVEAPKPVEVAKAPAPVVAKPAPVAPKPAAPKPVEVAKAAPAAAPTSGGAQVQLGAFANQALANTAWKSLSGRFAALSGLTESVQQAEVNGKTVYRLRASAGGKAGDICAKLKVAGEACLVVK